MRFKLICVTIAVLLAFSCIPASVSASSSELPDPVLVAFGDSIAAAGKWQTAFRALSGESVLNAGVGGNTSSDGLKRIASDVKNKKPDVVFIGFGTNDASIDMDRYVPVEKCAENLKSMVEKVREYGATPILITPPPIVDKPYLTRHNEEPFLPYGGPNGLLAYYALAVRKTASELNVPVADVNAAFLTRNYASLISDGVHPTDAGYKIYGEVIYKAYLKATAGDINLDGQMRSVDYMLLKRSLLNTYSMTKAQSNRADLNGNGRVEGSDYMLLKRVILKTYDYDRGVPKESDFVSTVYANLIPDSREADDMASNTKELQSCVDRVSQSGGGTVILPSGTFYFSTQGMNARQYEDYVCMPKNNVLVKGQGTSTVLKPVGNTQGGLDMFYFNEYADSGFKNPKYLINADFRDFVIDSELTHAARYTSAGKGFMFNLFRDCDFDSIICRNTDGTGFGVDCPINCTITNCEAYGCGKAGNRSSYGASGFGIGTGYAENESILIDNCYAEGNMKFGFFFEHQGRFSPSAYRAQKLGSCVVSNCTAKNNYNDFGGELALDLTYVNCVVPEDTTSVSAIAFRQHSIRCTLENMDVRVKFSDVTDPEQYYYVPVYWAVNHGITTGIGDSLFGITGLCTKGQALTFLYRIAGMPGELILGNGSEGQFYTDPLNWAVKNGIAAAGAEEEMKESCSRTEFITYLWKYAGSPDAEGSNAPAVNWALSVGLMDTVMETNILRKDAVTLLYRYFGSGNFD
ncbi:MAG: hypothetical protein II715_02725 [Clostridia bacterium]|nr:hypothetical protein [Clostridia bacterium]